jgi:DNA-binding transcriptional regulator YhcF (GntR family)
MGKGAQIRIDLNSPEPAYRQTAAQIRALIVEGVLATDAALPAVRRLAIDLGVHFNTVAEAYRQLASEGLIDVGHGRAARVLERRTAAPKRDTVEQFRRRLRHLVAEMKSQGLSSSHIRKEFSSLLDTSEGED